jgi:hypothetical protein
MKLVALSDIYIYMRLVAACLVHTGNILLAPASFSHDSCCIWPRNFFVGHASCALHVFV